MQNDQTAYGDGNVNASSNVRITHKHSDEIIRKLIFFNSIQVIILTALLVMYIERTSEIHEIQQTLTLLLLTIKNG